MKTETDEELITQIQQGNILAYEILVKRYQNKLLSFVYRFIPDSLICEEIVQDTFFNLYKSIEKVNPNQKFSTYLFQIAKNLTFSYLKRKKREISLENTGNLAIEDNNLEDIIRWEEDESLRSAINSLAKKYRKILTLYYFEELSYEDIGRRLSIPLNTVRTRLRRAKIYLAKTLKKNEKN